MTREETVAALRATKNETEWNAVCDRLKAAHNSNYPSWWFPAIMLSGLAADVELGWHKAEPTPKQGVN